MMRCWLVGVAVVWLVPWSGAQTPETAAAERPLDERIAAARQRELILTITDARGAPVAGATVELTQQSSAFRFGCNIFRFGELPEEQESRYRTYFDRIFNFATLPFYWWYYEPAPGETRAERMQAIAAWCTKQQIAVKGHPLFWNFGEQEWLPADVPTLREAALDRVEQTARAFHETIDVWDVVNEATNYDRRDAATRAPKLTRMWQETGQVELIRQTFARARAGAPQAMLLINDYHTGPEYEALIEQLREPDGGFPFDAIGIQSHMHAGEWPNEKIHSVCRRFGRFGLPLHFTEVTILSGAHGWSHESWPSTPEGEARQAAAVERVYSELFAQPAVMAITWWDFSDNGAWRGAPGGLLDADFRPKPAYRTLERLITREWWTGSESLKTDDAGRARLRVFHGNYAVEARADGGGATLRLAVTSDDGPLERVISLNEQAAPAEE